MIRINDIKIFEDLSNEEVFLYTINKYKISKNNIKKWFISKKSIDARKKNNVHYSYSIDLEIDNESKYLKNKNIIQIKEKQIEPLSLNLNKKVQPVVIGAGPSGLFAALTFIENGYKPIVIEQGSSIDTRIEEVNDFINNGKLNIYSNIQFGEGGAGTFSDGKLTTNINSPFNKKVINTFIKFGAPEQIGYLTKPHIGTDNLINVVKNMRNYIISQGGTFLFNTQFINFETKNNKISTIEIKDLKNNSIKSIETSVLILAIGHSSRSTFYKMYDNGLNMQPKNFSVGVRIEHLQKDINQSQYGTYTKLHLPPAEYKLAYHNDSGRSCYTFCMCPGGLVMPSSSDENTIVTNGMSYFARNGENANSAVLVNVTPEDFENNHPLAGIEFQKKLEEKAFKLGGSNYFAPVQRLEDFFNNKKSEHIGLIKPTYKPGFTLSNLNEIMPKFVADTLKEGIKFFDSKLDGFAHPDSILTGMETRSSSPVQITRNEFLESNIEGIYPCGEGAGYAGGIMTASIDGIKCARYAISKKNN